MDSLYHSGQRVEFLQGPDERSCWNFLAGIEIGETRKRRQLKDDVKQSREVGD